jgi:hypothetical protein
MLRPAGHQQGGERRREERRGVREQQPARCPGGGREPGERRAGQRGQMTANVLVLAGRGSVTPADSQRKRPRRSGSVIRGAALTNYCSAPDEKAACSGGRGMADNK